MGGPRRRSAGERLRRLGFRAEVRAQRPEGSFSIREFIMRESEIDGFDVPPSRPWLGPIIVVGALAIIGVIPYLLGFGFFASRVILSKDVNVYVWNFSGEELTFEIDFSEDVNLPAGMETVRTLTGPVSITARGTDGEIVEHFDIELERPVFYNANGSTCFAVYDVTAYYDGTEDSRLRLVDRIYQDDTFYEIQADTVVLPRRPTPTQAIGDVHWIEPVTDCDNLDPAYEESLLVQAEIRLQRRREEYEQALEEARGY